VAGPEPARGMAGSAHDIAAEGVLAVAEKAGLEGDPRSRAPTLVREDWSLSAIQSRCDPSGNRGAEPRYVQALAAELLEDAREHRRDGSAPHRGTGHRAERASSFDTERPITGETARSPA
jgi:hypothetical protein